MNSLSRCATGVTLLLCLLPAFALSCAGSTWVSEGTSPLEGGYGEGFIATDESIYILECQDASSHCYFYRYSVSDGVWRPESTDGLEIGFFRNGTALAWDGDGVIYALAGARYSDSNRSEFVKFDIEDGTWEPLSDTPLAQGAGNALTWSGYDSALYAFVGSSKHNGGVSEFLRYDPYLDQWEHLESPWQDTDDGASLTWDGGTHIYALRGEYDEVLPNGHFARYNMSTDDWESLAELPDSLGVGDGGSLLSVSQWEQDLSDFVFALSGASVLEDPGDRFFRYSVSRDEWDELPSIPCPVRYYVGNRLVYVAGKLYFWQGSPGTTVCGGDAFFSFELPSHMLVEARDDLATTEAATPILVDVLANDIGADLQIIDVQDAANGTTEIRDAHILYTPGTSFCGIEAFVYTIQDAQGAQDSATVRVNVQCASPLSLVINEIEMNPPGEDSGAEWIELYNPTSNSINMNGWEVSYTSYGGGWESLPNVQIGAGEYYVYTYTKRRLNNESDEPIRLRDPQGNVVDETQGGLADTSNSQMTHQRIPDGGENWEFGSSTRGYSNVE